MKIAEQSESRMVVRSSSLANLVGGLFFVLFGVLTLSLAHRTPAGLLTGLAVLVVGILVILAARRVTVTVDRLKTTVTVRSRRLLHSTSRTDAIADVKRLTTDQRYAREGATGLRITNNRWSNMILVYRDGSYAVLDREQGMTRHLPGGVTFNQGGDHTVEEALARCLGVPLVVDTDDIHAAVDESMRRKGRTPRSRPVPAPPSPVGSPRTVAPAWYADPAGSHELRYWDGTAWTAYVADQGKQALDPLPAGAGS